MITENDPMLPRKVDLALQNITERFFINNIKQN